MVLKPFNKGGELVTDFNLRFCLPSYFMSLRWNSYEIYIVLADDYLIT